MCATRIPLKLPHRATPMPAASKSAPLANPHYQQIGGEPVVRQLVDRFYALMEQLPQAAVVRAMHPADLAPARQRLFMFLSGWLGGPPLYAEAVGPPRLRHAHAGFAIDPAARDAWMACMNQALQELVPDQVLRQQLGAAFFKTADFLCNQ